MSFTIECPFCGQRVEVPDELNNTTANCPACGQEVYLTSDDAVEELDPAVEKIRREHAAAQKEHAAELWQFAMLQQQKSDADARAKKIINLLLWIFLWGPLCAIGGYLVFLCLFRIVTGHW